MPLEQLERLERETLDSYFQAVSAASDRGLGPEVGLVSDNVPLWTTAMTDDEVTAVVDAAIAAGHVKGPSRKRKLLTMPYVDFDIAHFCPSKSQL